MANVVLIGYVIVAMREDQDDRKAEAAMGKKAEWWSVVFWAQMLPIDRLGARWPPWKYDDMGHTLNKRHTEMCYHMGVMKIIYVGR